MFLTKWRHTRFCGVSALDRRSGRKRHDLVTRDARERRANGVGHGQAHPGERFGGLALQFGRQLC